MLWISNTQHIHIHLTHTPTDIWQFGQSRFMYLYAIGMNLFYVWLFDKLLLKTPYSSMYKFKVMFNFFILHLLFWLFLQEKCQKNGKKLNFHKVYLRVFWKNLCLAGFLRFFGDIIQFVGPWCIELIINYAYAQVKVKEGSNPTNGNPLGTSPSTVSIIPYNSSSMVSLYNQSVDMTTPSNTVIIILQAVNRNTDQN